MWFAARPARCVRRFVEDFNTERIGPKSSGVDRGGIECRVGFARDQRGWDRTRVGMVGPTRWVPGGGGGVMGWIVQ